ncbi:MAG: phosphatidylglycerophosphatase A [Endomicrobium sp.]|jgi:phosphatidylglycerophosphatase A|nr:phosphatidylglycerophosphatase A [Endomicrobium sp.]
MDKIVIFFSSVFGAGYIKYASGTFGSLVGILLWVLFVPDTYIFQIFVLAAIFIISVLFSSLAEGIYNKKDDRKIVVDEVAGMWCSVAFLPKTFMFLFAGFLLFRIFDIKKPLFIKKIQKIRGGFGITIDDIVAGIFANVILQIARFVIY